MKKLFTLALTLLCMAWVYAADNVDIIIKTNSEKIEALIQEVSDTEIKYKKANNPNGTLFIISLDEVATIIYANGEVQAIDYQKPTQQTEEAAPQQTQNRPNYGYYFSDDQMRREGNIYFLNNKPMKTEDMLKFMQQNCKQAYDQYYKNRKLERAGWALFGIGFGVTMTGGILNYYALKRDKDLYEAGIDYKVVLPVSYAIIGLGGALFVSSVPMICVGAVRKKNVHKVYNTWCSPKATSAVYEFHLTSGANGLGLALNF